MRFGFFFRIRLFAAAVLFLDPANLVSGQQINQTVSTLSKQWVLGIAQFTEEGLEPGASRSVYGAILPRLILASLPVLPTRSIAAASVSPTTDSVRKEAILYAAGKQLAQALDEKARIGLDPDMDAPRKAAELRTVEQKISNSRARIRELKGEKVGARIRSALGLNSMVTTAATAAPLSGTTALPETGIKKATAAIIPEASVPEGQIPAVWWKGSASDTFPESDQEGPTRTAAALNLDGLVFGSVRREGSDLIVTVKGYERYSGNIALLYTGRTQIQRPGDSIPAISTAIEEWIASRLLAKLDISVNPRNAIVSIDGMVLEGAVRRLFYYEPVTIRVSAHCDGFMPWKAMVDILPGTNRTIAVDLLSTEPSQKAKKETAIIDTEILKILDGGSDAGYGPTFNARKDRFYSALGILVGSIPATILAGGNFSLFAEASTRSTDSRIVTGYTVSAAILGAGIAATAFFAVNTIIRLVDYLGAAH